MTFQNLVFPIHTLDSLSGRYYVVLLLSQLFVLALRYSKPLIYVVDPPAVAALFLRHALSGPFDTKLSLEI